MSHYHPILVTLSPYPCHTITLSLSHHHHILVTLSPYPCHTITLSLSHRHHILVTLSTYPCHTRLSLSHYHPILVTLSPYHCHTITLSSRIIPSSMLINTNDNVCSLTGFDSRYPVTKTNKCENFIKYLWNPNIKNIRNIWNIFFW